MRLLVTAAALMFLGGCAAPAPRSDAAKAPADQPHAASATRTGAPASSTGTPDPELATMAPGTAELPNFGGTRRTLPAKIGVERYDSPPRKQIVADYSKVNYTEAEKKYLAEEAAKKAKDDLLAFYRPERGTEHGVSPFEGGGQIARFGRAGAGASTFVYPFASVGQLSDVNEPFGVYSLTDPRIKSYLQLGRTTSLDPIPAVQVGEGLRRDRSRTIDIDEN